MPRKARSTVGGYAYHVLNRANRRATLFGSEGDYAAFERILADALHRDTSRLLAYCLMPNHWHLVLCPEGDTAGSLARLMRWVTMTHALRWHAQHGTRGTGHVYQGRYKSFPVQADAHLLAVMRYVERNPLRAGLVARAELWPWSSARRRVTRIAVSGEIPLSQGPVPLPEDWLDSVNASETLDELARLRTSVHRGAPLGDREWTRETVVRLGLEHTLRPQGRPPRA